MRPALERFKDPGAELEQKVYTYNHKDILEWEGVVNLCILSKCVTIISPPIYTNKQVSWFAYKWAMIYPNQRQVSFSSSCLKIAWTITTKRYKWFDFKMFDVPYMGLRTLKYLAKNTLVSMNLFPPSERIKTYISQQQRCKSLLFKKPEMPMKTLKR